MRTARRGVAVDAEDTAAERGDAAGSMLEPLLFNRPEMQTFMAEAPQVEAHPAKPLAGWWD